MEYVKVQEVNLVTREEIARLAEEKAAAVAWAGFYAQTMDACQDDYRRVEMRYFRDMWQGVADKADALMEMLLDG